MKNKYVFVAVLLGIILAVGCLLTFAYLHAQGKQEEENADFKVVTSFYPMYIIAENIIGDCPDVTLENLSEPQTGCLHDYQLTADDMILLSTADVFVVNGGGIESFLSDVASSYPDLVQVNACERLELMEENAHAWMSMTDYMVQVETIRDALMEADPEHAESYEVNAFSYLAKVNALEVAYEDVFADMKGKHVVLFHEAYEYLANDLGMTVAGVMDLDEERQVSAGEVAGVVSLIEQDAVPLIFAEELYGKDMGDTVQKETDVTVLYLDALIRGDYNPDSYLAGMKANLEQLRAYGE